MPQLTLGRPIATRRRRDVSKFNASFDFPSETMRDRRLVIIIAGHVDRPIEPGKHLDIAAVDKLGTHEHA
jgi:hypothetical protein